MRSHDLIFFSFEIVKKSIFFMVWSAYIEHNDNFNNNNHGSDNAWILNIKYVILTNLNKNGSHKCTIKPWFWLWTIWLVYEHVKCDSDKINNNNHGSGNGFLTLNIYVILPNLNKNGCTITMVLTIDYWTMNALNVIVTKLVTITIWQWILYIKYVIMTDFNNHGSDYVFETTINITSEPET